MTPDKIAAKLTKRRREWLLSLPQMFTVWDWSERFSRRVVDYCVNQGLATWEIRSDEVGCIAQHSLTPLGFAVRDVLKEQQA